MTDPLGKTVDLGTSAFTGVKNNRPTTGNARFTAWRPADVTVTVDLYPNSDPAAVKTLTYGGKATPGGIFGALKKVKVSNALLDRGETHYEGYIEPNDGFRHLDHINFPYSPTTPGTCC